MATPPMWVVVEWNQASGRPKLADGELYDTWADARDVADNSRDNAKGHGRGERYTVHEVEMGGGE
jgi:hypothetical protein